MKKILLLSVFCLFSFLNMHAMKEITGEFQPWDANCQVNGNTINFLGEWNGITFKFYDEEGCIFEAGTDLSAFDMLVLKMSDVSCLFKIKTEYTDGNAQQDAWGAEKNMQPGALIVGIPLNAEHKNMVKDFFLQSSDYPGSITVEKVLACTKAEYEQLLQENPAKTFNLTLKKVNEGGGTSYNADTHTITIQDNGSHKGWFFNDQFRDFSAFDSFVMEFQTATENGGEIGIEYDEGSNTTQSFEAGTSRIIVPLSANKNHLRQVYIKGDAGNSYILKVASFTTNKATTGINSINTSKGQDNGQETYYTIDGKRLKKPVHGINIQRKNGVIRKVLIK
ncbi:hypothetical protein [Prevotella histicola]|uniref:Lipocalin-like domain-containing protein n=1 Tax=Prevotella histicola F0411 TaxID=857291 RepID=G6AJX7_9BACT|nr:hypothetical protein [Prevotella histicola]EHG15024.1 hypothetical protein HMPREF9138_02404 [Prevotella histicola F0411]QUB84762.1 hypothetical protein J5A62_11000 [Prevotella histicola]